MLSFTNKIYVQLAPDDATMRALLSMQSELDQKHRLVPQRELHLTVIHIGLLSRLYSSIIHSVDLSEKDFMEKAEILVYRLKDLNAEYRGRSYEFEQTGYNLFGPHKSSLVVTYNGGRDVFNLHNLSLQIVKTFLLDCGIADVDTFMASDANLRHAVSFHPHVTLAKSITPNMSIKYPSNVRLNHFSLMPIVYNA